MSYGKVQEVYWDSERIERVGDRAALLGLYMISGPLRNAIGCFKLGMGALTDNPRFGKWGIEGASEALSQLQAIDFIVRDNRTGWTFITNALKHDPIISPKGAIHALMLSTKVPKNTNVYKALKEALEPQLMKYEKHLVEKLGWPMPSHIEDPSEGHDMGNRSPLPSPPPEPLPAPQPSDGAVQPGTVAAPLLPAEEAKLRIEIGGKVVELARIDTARFGGDYSIVSAWVKRGYVPELDIYPTVEARAARPGYSPPNSLNYFSNAIETAYRNRMLDLGSFKRDPTAQPAGAPLPEGNPEWARIAGELTMRDDPRGHKITQAMMAGDTELAAKLVEQARETAGATR